MKFSSVFSLARYLIGELAMTVGSFFNLLADLFGDIEEGQADFGNQDLTGSTGVSMAGMVEPIAYTDGGQKVGTHSKTSII